MFLIFLAAYRDRDCVEAATSSKLTIGTSDQDDAVALALASNMTATDLDVSEIAVARHRCQTHVRSHIPFHLSVTRIRISKPCCLAIDLGQCHQVARLISMQYRWQSAVTAFCKATLPELRTYNCKQCGVTVTEAEEPRERRDY